MVLIGFHLNIISLNELNLNIIGLRRVLLGFTWM